MAEGIWDPEVLEMSAFTSSDYIACCQTDLNMLRYLGAYSKAQSLLEPSTVIMSHSLRLKYADDPSRTRNGAHEEGRDEGGAE